MNDPVKTCKHVILQLKIIYNAKFSEMTIYLYQNFLLQPKIEPSH